MSVLLKLSGFFFPYAFTFILLFILSTKKGDRNMKVFLRLITFAATVLFVVATVIKLTQKVSYKEAVGIMEDLCKEMMEKCPCCHKAVEKAPEESTPAEV
jgi:hypothetical protein